MTFDVASIRESRDVRVCSVQSPPKASSFHAGCVTPFGLILNAYALQAYDQLENVPEWAKTTMYDVAAKSGPAVDEALMKLSDRDSEAEQDHMLQELLLDRFKLKIHPEARQSTVYELFTTPRTAKLMTPFHGDIRETVSTCTAVPSTAGQEMATKGCPFSILLSSLRQSLGAPIVDHTGLAGNYAFDIKWGMSQRPDGEGTYPNLLFAVREQLGLELKRAKGTVTFWVVDHIERPTPN